MCDTRNLTGILERRGVDVTPVQWDDIRFDHRRTRLPGVDAEPDDVAVLTVAKVWTRDPGPELLFLFNTVRSLCDLGYRVANPDLSYLDKWLASCRFVAAGIPTPPTTLVSDIFEVSAQFRERGSVLLKPRVGRQGIGQVRLPKERVRLNDDGHIIGIEDSRVFEGFRRYGQLICQDLVEVDREFRVNVVDNQIVNAFRFEADGPFFRWCEPPPALAKLALSAVDAMGWSFGELDVLEAGGEYLVLEVNPVCNADAFQRASDAPEPLRGLERLADLLTSGRF
jgi:glutathione synthase/RimK-type ligase-like ATP-grasp enzyme